MTCFSTVRGDRLRVTKVDECGAVVTGVGSAVVTDGFISISYSPEIEDSEEINLKNAAGRICVLDRTRPQLKFYSIEAEFCQVNPELFAMMTGQTVITDAGDEPVGFVVTDDIVTTGFALEVWTEIPGQECVDGSTAYGYFLLPFVVNPIFGDFTIENDAITFTVNAETKKGNAWGSGPYDVVDTDGLGTAGPLLDPLATNAHLLLQQVTVAPPAIACDAVAV